MAIAKGQTTLRLVRFSVRRRQSRVRGVINRLNRRAGLSLGGFCQVWRPGCQFLFHQGQAGFGFAIIRIEGQRFGKAPSFACQRLNYAG